MAKSNEPLSPEMQGDIARLFAEGESARSIARTLDLSDSTVRKYLEKLGITAYKTAANDDPQEMLRRMGRQIARQSATISDLRKHVKAVNERGFGYDDLIDELKRIAAEERKNPLKYYPTTITKAKQLAPVPAIDAKHQEIVALALSDWHIAETVKLRDANYINVYNTMIGANRLWHIIQRFKQCFQIHRAAFGIEKIWLPVLGDMISGSVHEEFLVTNDMTDQASVILCARLLKMVILELKQLGVPIQLDCVVGNHPRTTKKVPTKGLAHSNLDWMVYMFVAMMFEGDPQVTVNIHTSQIGLVQMYGHRYVIEHGIDWKNGKEDSYEDAIRAILDDPIYREATGITGSAFDQIVIGNLHKGAWLERTVKNASLIGQNELGQQWRLRPIKAQQLMWGISRTHVRTFQYNLDATRIKSEKAENPMSEFAKNYLNDHGKYTLSL